MLLQEVLYEHHPEMGEIKPPLCRTEKHLPAGPRLVEPFAGSCAVMMETDYPSYLVADINPDLINLYKRLPLIVNRLYLAPEFYLRSQTGRWLITT